VPLLTIENLCKDRLDLSFGACLVQRYEYYSGNQAGSAVAKGTRMFSKNFSNGPHQQFKSTKFIFSFQKALA